MVQLRPEGWGQPISGFINQLASCTKKQGTGPRKASSSTNLPNVHVRVKLTDEGDVFEDFIPWDVNDPYLKDPETFAVSLGNDLGLSMAAVEELTRSITDQLRRHAASAAYTLILSSDELQAQAAKQSAEQDVPRKREMESTASLSGRGGGGAAAAAASAAVHGGWDQWQQQQPAGYPYMQQQQQPGGYGPMDAFMSGAQQYYPEAWGSAQLSTTSSRGSNGKKKKSQTPKFEIPPEGLDETRLPIRRVLDNGNRESDGLLDYYLDNPPPVLDQVMDALRAESLRVLRTMPSELKIVAGMSCHGCKHPMDASLLICPRHIGSHSLCGLHLQRFHAMSDHDAMILWEAARGGDPAVMARLGPLPVCLACSMACPCKVCQRAAVKRAFCVLHRYINVMAGRTPDYEGPGLPVMAEIHHVTVPHDFVVEQGINMVEERGNKRGIVGEQPPMPADAPLLSYGRRKSGGTGGGETAGHGDIPFMGGGGAPGLPKTKQLSKKHQKLLPPGRVPVVTGLVHLPAVAAPAPSPPPSPIIEVPKKKKKKPMVNLEVCVGCQQERDEEELLLCKGCPRAFHAKCVRKPATPATSSSIDLQESGGKDWLCELCRDQVSEETKLLVPTAAEEGRRDIERDCKRIIDTIMKHELAGAFCEPVDLEQCEDYLEYVKKPLDLKTLRGQWFSGRARKGCYFDVVPFLAEFRRVWHNCRMYNREGSLILALGEHLENIFEHNIKERVMMQLSPEAQVELKEKTDELAKEAEETMAELKKQGKLPSTPPSANKRGKAAAQKEEASGEAEMAVAESAEEAVKEEEDEEEVQPRPAKMARGGGGKGRGRGGRGQGGRGKGSSAAQSAYASSFTSDASHPTAMMGGGGQLGSGAMMAPSTSSLYPIDTQVLKHLPSVKREAMGVVVDVSPAGVYTVQYETGEMEWLSADEMTRIVIPPSNHGSAVVPSMPAKPSSARGGAGRRKQQQEEQAAQVFAI